MKPCRFAAITRNHAGNRIMKKDFLYHCGAPFPDVVLPASATKVSTFKWPPFTEWIGLDDCARCPCYDLEPDDFKSYANEGSARRAIEGEGLQRVPHTMRQTEDGLRQVPHFFALETEDVGEIRRRGFSADYKPESDKL